MILGHFVSVNRFVHKTRGLRLSENFTLRLQTFPIRLFRNKKTTPVCGEGKAS